MVLRHAMRSAAEILDIVGDANAFAQVALRHGVGVEQETTDAKQAYAGFRKREPARYREGWLPE